MSHKKYRPKLDQSGKPAGEKGSDPVFAPGTGGNSQGDQAKTGSDPLADPLANQARQARAAHETAAKAAKLINDEAQAEQRARSERAGIGHVYEAGKQDFKDWLAGLSDEELKAWREHGQGILDSLSFRAGGVSAVEPGPLTDKEVGKYLANGVRYLNQVVVLTSAVLDTIDVEYTRKIVAADSKPVDMRRALELLGYDPEILLGEKTGAQPARRSLGEGVSASDGCSPNGQSSNDQTQDWRKRPRGRRHPLLQLVALASTSVRLINQITRDTNPRAHNRATLQEREANRDFNRTFGGIASAVKERLKR